MPWFIPHAGFLERLSEEEKMRLGQICPPRSYGKDEAVFLSGDACDELTIVLDGMLKVVRQDPSGKERILHLSGPGDILGAEFLEDEARYNADAVCASDGVMICPINREQFVQVARELPRVALSLAGSLAARLTHLEDQIESASAPVIVRLGRVLAWTARRFGRPEADGWVRLTSELRQEDLAAMSGSTRVTVTNTLGQLRRLGLVEGTRGRYRVRLNELEATLEEMLWES